MVLDEMRRKCEFYRVKLSIKMRWNEVKVEREEIIIFVVEETKE